MSHDLKFKVIDASATTTSFNQQFSATQGQKRKNSVLIQPAPINLKLKGTSGNRAVNMRMSPLNKFLQNVTTATNTSKHKRTSTKNLKTLTINKSRRD